MKETILFYDEWLMLGDLEFYILLYIRLFSEDNKTLKCDIKDIKNYFWLKNTNQEIYQAIEELKKLKYIEYKRGRRLRDYTLTINDEYINKLVNENIESMEQYYKNIDKYFDVKTYRNTLEITRATKTNIDIILHFNRDTKGKRIDKSIVSVDVIKPIKLYIYSCKYDENFNWNEDFTTFDKLAFFFIEDIKEDVKNVGSSIKNASAFLSQCPLVSQKYCKKQIENEEEKKERIKRVQQAKAEGREIKREFIIPLGTVHYIIDTYKNT